MPAQFGPLGGELHTVASGQLHLHPSGLLQRDAVDQPLGAQPGRPPGPLDPYEGAITWCMCSVADIRYCASTANAIRSPLPTFIRADNPADKRAHLLPRLPCRRARAAVNAASGGEARSCPRPR